MPNHGSVVDVQRLVQVDQLHGNARQHGQQPEPGEPVGELLLVSDTFFDGQPKAFDGNHREGADQRANGNVDQDVGVPVARSGVEHEDQSDG